MSSEQHPALAVWNLGVAYEAHWALRRVTACAWPGAITGVIGPNGAGKSTLVKAVMGLVRPQEGRIEIGGRPVGEGRRRIAYIPQRSEIDWEFPILVEEVVAMGRYRHRGWFRRPSPADRRAVADALAETGLEGLARRPISRLSGGQQQRVFLARALAQGADLLLLDEPFAGVDAGSEARIVEVLRRERARGKAVLVIHHDLNKVPHYFDHLWILQGRLVAAGPTPEVFTPVHLQAAYASDPRGRREGPGPIAPPAAPALALEAAGAGVREVQG